MKKLLLLLAVAMAIVSCSQRTSTRVSIDGEKFCINDKVTFEGKSWRGHSIEGLLPNSRMVNGIFDDMTDSTRYRWAYPDTGEWDAERNVSEFIENMALWREHGLLAFTINLQGGSPQGYSKEQPWRNTAINHDGTLDAAYMDRLARVLDRADELGMVAIVGLYYFGQEKYIDDEAAVLAGIKNSVEWILERGYTNVLIEINNECNFYHIHKILLPERVHECIAYAKSIEVDGRRLLVSTSYGGGFTPSEEVIEVADFVLLHGNGKKSGPERIIKMAETVRGLENYKPMPIVVNEDDHYDFDKPMNNFVAATSVGVSWGFFDFRVDGESFEEGYQCVPTDWGINSDRKRGFFGLVKEWSK